MANTFGPQPNAFKPNDLTQPQFKVPGSGSLGGTYRGLVGSALNMAGDALAPTYTAAGRGIYNGVKNLLGIGTKAKNPSDNLTAPSNTLDASQTRTTVPASTGSTSSGTMPSPGTTSSSGLLVPNNPAQYSYSGGVNGAGQAYPGFNSNPQSVPQPNQGYQVGPSLQGSLITGLANAPRNNPAVDQARRNLQDLQGNYAQATSDIESRPSFLPQSTGEQGILNRLFAAKQAAAQSAMSNALQSQTLEQQALGQAASLNAPIQAPYGVQIFNPASGVPSGGGVAPTDPFYQTLQSYAQALASNQGAAIPSSITSNPVLQAQLLQMARQINPGFNYNVAQGTGAAQQANAQLGGTAGTSAYNSVFQQAYGTYAQLQNSVNNIDQFGALLLQTVRDGGINPSDVKVANQKLADIRNQLSSSQQAVYDNTLASLRSRVSGLLAAGGSEVPSAITADAQKIFDGSLPLSSLTVVMNRIKLEGQTLLQNQGQIVNNAYQGTQAGTPNGQASGNTVPAGGYQFKQVNGQWVPV